MPIHDKRSKYTRQLKAVPEKHILHLTEPRSMLEHTRLICQLRAREQQLRAENLRLRLAGTPLPVLARARGLDVGACVLPKFMFPETYDQSAKGRESTVLRIDSAEATSTNKYNEALIQHYTAVVIEHHLKWRPLLRRTDAGAVLGKYDFTHADRMVDWCIDHGFKVKGHVLIWHVTSPTKVLKQLSDADFATAVKVHIFMVMGHFKGRIKEWDVVNEALAPDGSMADTLFLQKMGPKYIAQCFRWAHMADPDATLLYNDNKVEGWGLGSPHSDKAGAFFKLLKSLVDDDVPIHGCGIQGHFVGSGVGVRRPPTPRAVARLIRRVGTLRGVGGLPLTVNLSEFDVRVAGLLTAGDAGPSSSPFSASSSSSSPFSASSSSAAATAPAVTEWSKERDQRHCDSIQRVIIHDIVAACCAQANFTGADGRALDTPYPHTHHTLIHTIHTIHRGLFLGCGRSRVLGGGLLWEY
jgi:GH35 family endo-1,4-beta-xylanase